MELNEEYTQKALDLTISIVAYHNMKDISEAIDSIENYTDKSLQKKIYIIDNGNSPKEYYELVHRYMDVEYVNLSYNMGFGKGHNYLLNKVNSKFHAIVNPDIILVEDTFSRIIKRIKNIDNNVVIIPKIVDQKGEMQKAYRNEPTIFDFVVRMFLIKVKVGKNRYLHHTMNYQDYSKEFEVPFAQGSFMVMPTSFFKKLKGFDERFFMYMEDADFCKRANFIGKVIYYPKSRVIHKWEKGSHKNIELLIIHVESIIKFFKKWGIKIK